ncbi:S1 family peptidase [Streptomyces ehimensis]|uniref:S1 family peptidase n=1 Tax=Streptomyces ehimensis TaxID=68195 RepID=A0ABV9BLK3_9ACTN
MSVSRRRATGAIGLLASTVTAGLLTAAPAHAVVGATAKDGSYTFTAKLDIGGERSCSGALVESQWLVTAASCFADNPEQGFKVAAGAPKLKTTATIGRADLTRDAGTVSNVVELVPHADRDLVMAKLEKPVTSIAPVNLGFNALVEGEDVFVSGYGRTKDEWVPDRLHYGQFTVGTAKASSVNLTGKSDNAVICEGDTGAPAFREVGGRYELVGVNSRSWMGGCLGHEAETRKGALDTRTDDIAGWIQSVSSRDLLKRSNWKYAKHIASGYFTGDPASNSKRRMDLFVAWEDGEASLFKGADHDDPKYPFSAEYKLESKGSYWKNAEAVTAGRYSDSGTDGLTVRWANGKLSTYTHVDEKGFHEEKTLAEPGSWWSHARLITSGRFSANALRDDLIVLWEDGSTSMYTDTGANGVKKETQLTLKNDGFKNAVQINAGEFTGGKTADLMIRWNDGQTQVFPTGDTKGDHGRIQITPVGYHWTHAAQITVGNFTKPGGPLNDILVRWDTTDLSYYPNVTPNAIPSKDRGPVGEVQLVG